MLRHVGTVSQSKLKDARTHLGAEVPLACVDTVEDLKALVAHAEKNRWAAL